MIIVRIDTNISASNIDEEFLVLVTESLATSFQKSKSEIMAFINSDLSIGVRGSSMPAAVITVNSVNGINGIDNKLHSAALFALFTKYLKIDEKGIQIVFTAVDPHYIGRNGKILIQ